VQVDLQEPVTVDGTEYKSVTLRRVNGRGMSIIADHLPAMNALAAHARAAREAAPGTDPDVPVTKETIGGMIAMIAAVTRLPVEIVEEFDFADIVAIAEKAPGFLVPATSHSRSTTTAPYQRSRTSFTRRCR
jgi:hypothetical protein